MSVKSKKKLPYTQCPHPRKFGDFCGIHHKAKQIIRIDTVIDASSGNARSGNVSSGGASSGGASSGGASSGGASSRTTQTNHPNTAIALTQGAPPLSAHVSSASASSSTSEPATASAGTRLNLPRLPQPILAEDKPNSVTHYHPEDLPLTDQPDWKKVIESCLYYKIDFKGSPADFLSNLTDWLLTRWISEDERRGPGLKLYQGPLFENCAEDPRSVLNYAKNETEFYDMIPIGEIPLVYLFSFEEQNQEQEQEQETGEKGQKISERNLYVCDLRSLHQIILRTDDEDPDRRTPSQGQDKPKNPYTNMPLTPETIMNYRQRVFLLRQNHITLDYPEDVIEPEKRYELKILEIFQKIYHFGWHVDHRWYLELNPGHILRRRLYFCLEDLWNYRLNMTKTQKLSIVPYRIFSRREKATVDRMSEDELRFFLAERMEDLVTKGSRKDDRANGAMYILLAFIQVSRPAALALPVLCRAIDFNPND